MTVPSATFDRVGTVSPRDVAAPVLTFEIPAGSAAPALARAQRRRVALMVVLLTLGASLIAAASFGAVEVPALSVLGVVLERAGMTVPWEFDRESAGLLWAIRIPRVLFGALVGATLAAAGGALQGLFRNPLADPSVIGVSSGAALATASFIVLGGWLLDGAVAAVWVPWLMPVAAFGGASVTAVLVLTVSRQRGRANPSVATMLLAGIAINALAGAGTGLLTSVANDTQLRALAFWSLGSLGGATWSVLSIAAIPMLLSLALLLRAARPLDLLLLGEREATHLGVSTDRLRQQVIAGVALGVGTAVAFAGMIGFVGLIIPHLVRMVVGPSHRGVLPLSALLGATLLVLTDLGARTLTSPAELPIGAVTAALGAPVFLWMVVRHRSGAYA